MLGFIVAGTLLLIGYLLCLKKTITDPATLFCLEWGFISLLAAMRLFTLYEASAKTWCIILVGSVFFVLGVCFGEKIRIRTSVANEMDVMQKHSSLMSNRFFWLIVVILFIRIAINFRQTIAFMINGYSLGAIREASVGMTEIDGYSRSTGAFAEYGNLILDTLSLFVIAHGIESGVFDLRKNRNKLVAVFALTIMQSLTDGGRFILAYFAIELLFCYAMYKSQFRHAVGKMSRKMKKIIKRLVFVLGVAIIGVTLIRGARAAELVKKYYRYICGNIVFFDLHVKDLDSSGFLSYSFAGLYGFWAVVLPILNRLGIGFPNIYLETISNVMNGQTFRQIGNSMSTNAFITPFYHIYADGRLFGVILGMFLFGVIAGLIYKKARRYKNGAYTAIYLVVVQMVFKTLQTYPFATKIYVLAFFAIWILNKRCERSQY